MTDNRDPDKERKLSNKFGEVKKLSQEESKVVMAFLPTLLCYVLWYSSIKRRAELDPINYAVIDLPTVEHVRGVLNVPTQDLYIDAKNLFEEFLDGVLIQPSRVQSVIERGNVAQKNMFNSWEAAVNGRDLKKLGYHVDMESGDGFPAALTDSFYPAQLMSSIAQYLNDKGIITMPTYLRELTREFIAEQMEKPQFK